MKIVKDRKTGLYSVKLKHGRRSIPLHTKDPVVAGNLVESAGLPKLEMLAQVEQISAAATRQLNLGGAVLFAQAMEGWKKWAGSLDLSPSTLFQYTRENTAWVHHCNLSFEKVSQLSEQHIDAWINADDGLSMSTKQVRFTAISSFCRYCHGKGLTSGDVSKLCGVRKRKLTFEQKESEARVPFTDEELGYLYRWDDPFWSVAIRLSNECGLRLSDCCLIGADQVQDGRLIVWMTKTQTRITMPMPAGVVLPNSVPCFPEIAARYQDESKRTTISQRFASILKRIGIEGKSFHCLRHTFATRHAALGATVDEIRMKLGHADSATTARYIHPGSHSMLRDTIAC